MTRQERRSDSEVLDEEVTTDDRKNRKGEEQLTRGLKESDREEDL